VRARARARTKREYFDVSRALPRRRSKLFVNPLNTRVSGRVRYEANRNSVKGTVRASAAPAVFPRVTERM
jgi:hypothetical protein